MWPAHPKISRTNLIGGALLPAVAAILAGAIGAAAQDTPDYFRQNCASCHTIGGGRLTGPDLKDVTVRQNREWLTNFILNPKAVIDSGDAYAQKIFEEARRVPMPTGPNMNRERAEKLLDLIETESEKEESQFKGLKISTAPFTPQDVAQGRALFLGTRRLEAGGTACISCHSIHDVGVLGGGRLSLDPEQADLTNVYDRLKGRNSLSAWLVAPGTETMQPVFKDHPLKSEEIHALVAYFEDASRRQKSDPTPARAMFLLLGLGGAAGMMFAFDAIWKWRFRGVRGPLVESGKTRGAA